MGIEFIFKITPADMNNLARHVDEIDSLEKVFCSAPFYISKYESVYSYSSEPDNENIWPSTVSLCEGGFILCIYNRAKDSADIQLMDYLIYELLDRCGRVEVEEA